jgi:hypothetical protein
MEVDLFRSRTGTVLIVVLIAATAWSCQWTPPPPRAPIPSTGNVTRERDPIKPMPAPAPTPKVGDTNQGVGQPGPADPPGQRAYLDAHRRVGRPRIALFVNRTLSGALLPASDPQPEAMGEQAGTPTTMPATVPAPIALADYLAIESVLFAQLSADGQVTVVPPEALRQRLSEQQQADLEAGRVQMLPDLAAALQADVLVQVQVQPVQQTPQGLDLRLTALAINARGGVSIGRAMVDLPAPQDRPKIDRNTGFVARRLMDAMAASWAMMVTEQPPGGPTTRSQ